MKTSKEVSVILKFKIKGDITRYKELLEKTFRKAILKLNGRPIPIEFYKTNYEVIESHSYIDGEWYNREKTEYRAYSILVKVHGRIDFMGKITSKDTLKIQFPREDIHTYEPAKKLGYNYNRIIETKSICTKHQEFRN